MTGSSAYKAASVLVRSLQCDFCLNGYARRYKSCPLCGFPHRQARAVSVGFGIMALLQGFRLMSRCMGGVK